MSKFKKILLYIGIPLIFIFSIVAVSYLTKNTAQTKYYEIDIVSATKDCIFFTEVKYRKNSTHGEPLDFIDQKKQKQMSYAAESFMQFLSKKLKKNLQDLPSPVLAVASVSGEDFRLEKWFVLEQ